MKMDSTVNWRYYLRILSELRCVFVLSHIISLSSNNFIHVNQRTMLFYTYMNNINTNKAFIAHIFSSLYVILSVDVTLENVFGSFKIQYFTLFWSSLMTL